MGLWRSIKILAPRVGLWFCFLSILALFFQLIGDHLFAKELKMRRGKESLWITSLASRGSLFYFIISPVHL